MSNMPTREQLDVLYGVATEKCTGLADVIQFALYEKALTMEGSSEWINDFQAVVRELFPTDGDGSQDRISEYFRLSERQFMREVKTNMEQARLIEATHRVIAQNDDGETWEFWAVIGIDYDSENQIHREHDESYRHTGIRNWLPEDVGVGFDLDGEFRIISIE